MAGRLTYLVTLLIFAVSAVYILGMPLETHVFTLFVSITISTATLAWSDLEERGRPFIKGTLEEIIGRINRRG